MAVCLWSPSLLGLALVTVLGFCDGQQVSSSCSSKQLALDNLKDTVYWPAPSNDSGLGPLSSFVQSFLGTVQPNPFPKDLLVEVIKDTTLITHKETTLKILQYEVGFLVCTAIGVLFIVLVPVVGYFFACCRCCGNCGGRMHQEQTKSIPCRRRCLYLATVVITAILLVGNICMFLSNAKFTVNFNQSPEVFNNTVDNLDTFVTTVPQQIDTVVNESSSAVNAVQKNLDDIGPLLGRRLQQVLNTSFQLALNTVLNISQELNGASFQVGRLNHTLQSLQSKQVELQNNFTSLIGQINSTLQKVNCTNCSNFLSQLEGLTFDLDFNGISQLNELQLVLKSAEQANLSSAANTGQDFLNSIPQKVTEQSNDMVNESKKQLQEIEKQISQVSKDIDLHNLTFISEDLQKVRKEAGQYFPDILKIDNYRWIAGLVLSSVVLLVVVCNILGLLLGPIGLKSRADPTQRSGMADCGGMFFMVGAGFSFLFSWLFMLVVLILFLAGGNIYTLVCRPWGNQELLQVIDTPGLIPNFQLSTILGVKSNLTFTKLYKDCHDNMSLWKTLHLSELIDLDSLLNVSTYTGQIEAAFDMDNITLPPVTLLGAAARSQLTNMSNMAKHIDFTNVTQKINYFYQADLNSKANSLEALAATVNDHGVKSELQNNAYDMRRLNNWTQTNITPLLVDLNSIVTNLSAFSSGIPGMVNNVVSEVDNAQTFINTNTSGVIKTESKAFLNCQIRYFETYADWAKTAITQDVGRCRPVADAVDAAEVVMCSYLVETMNGFWFSLGWCMAFLLPSIILSIKLAKFYRRMKYTDVYEDHIPMTDMPRAVVKR
ncbi:prominin-2 [Amia ocellicauda]|uniref:prominin-2 n=1 Tax=Amia ocellicauda TaxID=2972642 RepID=UPI003463EFBA